MTLDFIYHYNLKDAIGASHNGTYNEKSDNCYFISQAVIFGYLFFKDIIKIS